MPELAHGNQTLWIYYRDDLRIRRRARQTQTNYWNVLYSADRHLNKSFLATTTLDVKAYLASGLDRLSPATINIRYVILRAFFNFLVREEMIPVSPMNRVTEPEVPDRPPRIPTFDDVKALLGACSGTSFRDRRDNALIRLMLEPGGPRKAEIIFLKVSEVDLDNGLFQVTGKGDKTRYMPYSAKTGQALMRYLIARDKHKSASTDALWVGKYGPMKYDSLPNMLKSRCRQAGIRHINPHALRHFSADRAMQAGISDLDLMTLFGWESNKMLEVYARANRTGRAIASARAKALGDQI